MMSVLNLLKFIHSKIVSSFMNRTCSSAERLDILQVGNIDAEVIHRDKVNSRKSFHYRAILGICPHILQNVG